MPSAFNLLIISHACLRLFSFLVIKVQWFDPLALEEVYDLRGQLGQSLVGKEPLILHKVVELHYLHVVCEVVEVLRVKWRLGA